MEEPVSLERTKLYTLYVFACILFCYIRKYFKRLTQKTIQKINAANGVTGNSVQWVHCCQGERAVFLFPGYKSIFLISVLSFYPANFTSIAKGNCTIKQRNLVFLRGYGCLKLYFSYRLHTKSVHLIDCQNKLKKIIMFMQEKLFDFMRQFKCRSLCLPFSLFFFSFVCLIHTIPCNHCIQVS